MPLTEARSSILQRIPTDSPERWRELAAVDAGAARALASASDSLPPALSGEKVQRLGAVLGQMETLSLEIAAAYDGQTNINQTQDDLRNRIDAHSAALQARCKDSTTLPGGCQWSGPMPADPDGSSASSLRAFVQAGRAISIQDPQANTTWSSLLDALQERAEAIDAEAQRETSLQEAFTRLQALDEEEVALLGALADACPAGLPPVAYTAEIPLPTTATAQPPAPEGGGEVPPVPPP